MKAKTQKYMTIWTVSFLMLLIVSDCVLADHTETTILDIGYYSDSDNSVNLMDITHESEADQYNTDNFTFFSDGIYHGSDVPESSYTLQTTKTTHERNWLKLEQNVTFPSSLFMSGTATFWLRLPVRMCSDGECSNEGNYIYDKNNTNLWINNSVTNQSFQYTGSYLYNDALFLGASQYRHDFNHGRVILELNLPLYTNQDYTFTFRGKVNTGEQATIYTTYGDFGKDKYIGSSWYYDYYDTVIGQAVSGLSYKMPMDLGYSIIAQEGLPTSGLLGLKFTVPQSGQGLISLNSSWNKTDTVVSYHITLPISPAGQYNLTMDFRVYEYRSVLDYSEAVYFDDVTWNDTFITLSFDHQITANSTGWAIELIPQNNQSQQFYNILHDNRIQDGDIFDRQNDGQSVYDYNQLYYEWRGTNYTVVPRSTRGSLFQNPAGELFVQGTAFMGEVISSTPLSKGVSLVEPVMNMVGEDIVESGKSDYVDDWMEEFIALGEQSLSSNDYQISDVSDTLTGMVFNVPTMTPKTTTSGSTQDYNQNLNFKMGDVIENLAMNTGMAITGYNRDVGPAIMGMDASDLLKLTPMAPAGQLLDDLNVFSTIEQWGADLIESITTVINKIISLGETILSILIAVASILMGMVFIVFGGAIWELVYQLSRGNFSGMYKEAFRILSMLKGGGGK